MMDYWVTLTRKASLTELCWKLTGLRGRIIPDEGIMHHVCNANHLIDLKVAENCNTKWKYQNLTIW